MSDELPRPAAERVPAAGAGRALADGLRKGMSTSDVLGDLVLDRTSNPLTAFHVLSFIGMWGLFVETLDREPKSVRELAEVMKRNPRTLDRWAGKFRDAFPEHQTPAVLWARVRAGIADPQDRVPNDADQLALRLGGAHL